MTKMVRIENADTSNHKVMVETWAVGVDGKPDTLLRKEPLDNPTQLLVGWVWKEQYLVIREVE
jgi:hypothetical protein